MTPERLSAWRIFPRLLITLYGIAFWRTTEWFMDLPDPTNAQSAFVSVVVGAGAAWFGLYVGGTRIPTQGKKADAKIYCFHTRGTLFISRGTRRN